MYAPEAYQSADLDYIANFAYFRDEFDAILSEIGYSRQLLRVYRCPVTPLSLEFPNDENMMVATSQATSLPLNEAQ